MVRLTIDGKEVQARQGEKVLWAALDNGIYIPHLCAIRGAEEPHAGCRLCFVEIEGRDGLVTACTEPAVGGMVVHTSTERVKRIVATVFELLLASHPVDCAHCLRSGGCELQRLARFLGIKLKSRRFRQLVREFPIDDSHPAILLDPNKCILCHRCIWTCRQRGIGALGYINRGFERRIGTFGDMPLAEVGCEGCEACAQVCPVGALAAKR
jgi:formate dehydrogenase major subunit/NADH-quinone oxidoreductase subunit G